MTFQSFIPLIFLGLELTLGYRYWGVFWIDASSEENAESGFASLGLEAGKGPTFAAGCTGYPPARRPGFSSLTMLTTLIWK